jgi:hypothetical protein
MLVVRHLGMLPQPERAKPRLVEALPPRLIPHGQPKGPLLAILSTPNRRKFRQHKCNLRSNHQRRILSRLRLPQRPHHNPKHSLHHHNGQSRHLLRPRPMRRHLTVTY